MYFTNLKMSNNTKTTPPIENQAFQIQALAQHMEMINMVIENLEDMMEKRRDVMLKLMVCIIELIWVEKMLRDVKGVLVPLLTIILMR